MASDGGGGGGSGRASITTAKRCSFSPPPSPKKKLNLNADDLSHALSLAVAATSSSLLLLPSSTSLPSHLSSSLASILHSSSSSLSFLLSLLPSFLHPSPPFFSLLRMSSPTFDLLLQTLTPALSPPAGNKLAAALFRLSHAAPFPYIAQRFDLESPELACKAFYEVCNAVTARLGHLFELPSDPRRVLQGFAWISLPRCRGALGFSRFGPVVAQAVVDSEGRFLDVSAGWPGEMSPANIFERTKFYESQMRHFVEQVEGGDLPTYFIGGTCCPLLPWLITPFEESDGRLNSSKMMLFNKVHARGMELVDQAFGSLRRRWRLLGGEWKADCAEALPLVIVVGCLLHNFLIKCSEPVPDEVEMIAAGELGFEQYKGKRTEEGKRVRELLASRLSLVSQDKLLV